MAPINKKTEKTSKPAKPAAAVAAKPKKTALERVFTTAARATQSAAKLERNTGGWTADGNKEVASTLQHLRSHIANLSKAADAIKGAIVTLQTSGFKPKAAAVKIELKVGVRVELKEKVREKRFDFLSEEQLGSLYVAKADERGYLIECRVGGGSMPIGYLKRGAIVAQPAEIPNGVATGSTGATASAAV